MNFIILKEQKNDNRVALIPNDAKTLIKNKHQVFVQENAGLKAGFSNDDYLKSGCKLFKKIKEVITQANLIFKLSKPKLSEIKKFKSDQVFCTLLPLVSNVKILRKFITKKITSLDLEQINDKNVYPFLLGYERLKGNYSINIASYYLAKNHKYSKGKTLGSILKNPGKTNLLLINGSYASYEAIKVALSSGANVTLLESNDEIKNNFIKDKTIKILTEINNSEFRVLKNEFEVLSKNILNYDIVINTSNEPGQKNPKKITEEMIASMSPGSICIDLAIDHGIAIDGIKKPKNFKNPTVTNNGVILYAYNKIPSLFPNEVSNLTSNNIVKYFNNLEGTNAFKEIIKDKKLKNSLITYQTKIVNETIASNLKLMQFDIDHLIK